MKSSVGKYSARIPSSVHSTLPSTLDVQLRRKFRLRWWWAVVIPAVFSLGMLGCGGGGSKPQPPQPPSNLVYPQTAIAATVGVAITPDVPTVTGSVTSFSVSPALPAGLSLDGSTGTISGTPTSATGQAKLCDNGGQLRRFHLGNDTDHCDDRGHATVEPGLSADYDYSNDRRRHYAGCSHLHRDGYVLFGEPGTPWGLRVLR